MPFNCTICGEESTHICVWCTKDTCANHLCSKCGRCSDCCECEVPLDGPVHEPAAVYETVAVPEPVPVAEPDAVPADAQPVPVEVLEPAPEAAVVDTAPPVESAPTEPDQPA